MIKTLNENVVVEVLEEEQQGGILVPDTHKSTKYGAGRVVAIEEDMPIKEGDTVYFDTVLLTCVKIQDRELRFIKFSDILGYESN